MDTQKREQYQSVYATEQDMTFANASHIAPARDSIIAPNLNVLD